MGKKEVIATYDPEKKPSIAQKFHATEDFFTSRGIKLKLKTFNGKKTAEEIKKAGKKGEFIAELDGRQLTVRLEYGSKKVQLASLDLDAEKDVKKRREVMAALKKGTKLVDKATWESFQRANPDPDKVKELEFAAYDANLQLTSIASSIAALKKFRYDKHSVSGKGGMMLQLKEAARKKKVGQYFDFVEAVDAGKDAKKTYEAFVKKGAKKRVSLPKSTRSALDDAYEADGALDLKPARDYAVGVIDKKIVPKISASIISAYKKDAVRWKKRKDEANKALKAMGREPRK